MTANYDKGWFRMEMAARFEQVSEHQFLNDWTKAMGGDGQAAKAVYASLRIPERATAGSAGYDFFAPVDFTLLPGCSVRLPTGIRVKIREGWLLAIFPRSGLGFKYRLRLDNTVGIVDSDYYGADNEGHIQIQMTNCNPDKPLSVKAGEGFAQGIFLPFGLAEGDAADGMRHGGFGSTTPRE